MSEMPETIYVEGYMGGCVVGVHDRDVSDDFGLPDPLTKYTRSDLCVPRADVAKLVDSLKKIAYQNPYALVDGLVAFESGLNKGFRDASYIARAALAEFNAKHGE